MKILVTNYTFNAAAKTITFNDFESIELKRVLVITNTTDNIIIYNFAALGGTVDTNVLNLAYDTTSMSDGDDLQVLYDAEIKNITSTAYTASMIVKEYGGTLLSITGYNSGSSSQFIQVHDASSLPADTAVPALVFKIPGDSNFSFELSTGRTFLNGITVCNSSTGPTKTIGSANCWFDIQYI